MPVDGTRVPLRERGAFVAMQVRRAAPFPDPEHHAVWSGDHAAVWYWSRERVRELASAGREARFQSDSAWRGQEPPAGVTVVELLQWPAGGGLPESGAGCEGRIWHNGRLTSSRWWNSTPRLTEWQAFLRAGSVAPQPSVPEPTPAELRDQPLGGGLDASAIARQLGSNREALITVASAMALTLLAWQLASVARVAREISSVMEATVPLEQELETVIGARARADEAAAAIVTGLALRPPASQTRLMAEVQAVTPGGGWTLSRWHMAGPDALEVTLHGDGLDVAEVVAAWEASSLLQDVTPSTGRGDELVLHARLTPLEQQ